MPETTHLQLLNLTQFSSQCVRNYSFPLGKYPPTTRWLEGILIIIDREFRTDKAV